jgi:hypothetical protein
MMSWKDICVVEIPSTSETSGYLIVKGQYHTTFEQTTKCGLRVKLTDKAYRQDLEEQAIEFMKYFKPLVLELQKFPEILDEHLWILS